MGEIYIYINKYIYIYKPKPHNPPYTPFWGVLLRALRGQYISEKTHPTQKFGLKFLRSPRLLPGLRGVRPYQLDCTHIDERKLSAIDIFYDVCCPRWHLPSDVLFHMANWEIQLV